MKSKRLCSILMCSLIVCSSSANVFAYSSSNSKQPISKEFKSIKLNLENSFSSDYYYDELAKLGFTESEMYDLYLKESNKFGIRLSLPNKLSKSINQKYVYPIKNSIPNNLYRSHSRLRGGFPSNPQIGRTYEITHTVTMADLATALGVPAGLSLTINTFSKHEIAKALAKIVGLGSVGDLMAIAAFILSMGTVALGHNYGVQWTQKWYYGEDNHMSIGWTPGYAYNPKWI